MAKAKFADLAEMPKRPLETAAQTVILEPDNHQKIATLAFKFWIQRGCPMGNAAEDWFRAEEVIKKRKVLTATAA